MTSYRLIMRTFVSLNISVFTVVFIFIGMPRDASTLLDKEPSTSSSKPIDVFDKSCDEKSADLEKEPNKPLEIDEKSCRKKSTNLEKEPRKPIEVVKESCSQKSANIEKEPNEVLVASKVQKDYERIEGQVPNFKYADIPYPILIWWYGFSHEKGKVKKCGNVKCFVSTDRKYFDHPSMKGILMYGTNFDYMDMPVPRKPYHEWALYHEESPHNNDFHFSHPEIMELFNHTTTFKRESDMPQTTVWLQNIQSLESKRYLVPIKKKNKLLSELALVNYVHSNCGGYSDRDHFFDMMSKYIKIDSYGMCKHNKELPLDIPEHLSGMLHTRFFEEIAKYKFTIASENAICDDYITEKLWRPLEAGSVPIIIGSPKVRDFLPNNHSAIIVDEFSSMKDLVELILYLNSSDSEYNKYLEFKRPGGVTNQYLLKQMKERRFGRNIRGKMLPDEAFECLVCKRMHKNMNRERADLPTMTHQATVEHYGCPKPLKFRGEGPNDLERVENDRHSEAWTHSRYEIMALSEYWRQDLYNYTWKDIRARTHELLKLHENFYEH